MLNFISLLFIFFSINIILCEEYNLIGGTSDYELYINVGHPHQQLKVLLDTGSATLAISAFGQPDDGIYFHPDNSSSIHISKYTYSSTYSQGSMLSQLASDFVHVPSIPSLPEVRTDIGLVTMTHNVFFNGSYQGVLGLAYDSLANTDDTDFIIEPWLDTLHRQTKKAIAFQFKFCSTVSPSNSTYYGKFNMLDDEKSNENHNPMFRTPVLRRQWYEVGVLSFRLVYSNSSISISNNSIVSNLTGAAPNADICRKLNALRSIVDTGTTDIKLPRELNSLVLDEIKRAAKADGLVILNDFWYKNDIACWPQPQKWNMPWIEIDLLSTEGDDQYFTLKIPPENYMRVIIRGNLTEHVKEDGIITAFCYYFAIQSGGDKMILGYTAMEGLQVLFNRTAGWVGWQESDCGPDARVKGPFNMSASFVGECLLTTPSHKPEVSVSIKAAQWTLFVMSIVAAAVLLFLLAPCLKLVFKKSLPSPPQISLSQAALVEQELT